MRCYLLTFNTLDSQLLLCLSTCLSTFLTQCTFFGRRFLRNSLRTDVTVQTLTLRILVVRAVLAMLVYSAVGQMSFRS